MLDFRFVSVFFTLLVVGGSLAAQQVEVVTDEQCGCEIRYVDGIQTTQKDGLFGFRLKDGTQIVPNRYRYVDEFHGNYCMVYQDHWHCGLIDRTGREVLPCIYTHVEYPSENRILVREGDLWGFTDLEGRVVIAPQYPNASSFSEGVACAAVVLSDSITYLCMFIDTLGTPLFPPTYDNLSPLVNGKAMAFRYGGWGVIDRWGNTLLPHSYESISMPMGGCFFAGSPNGYALFDTAMHRLTDFRFREFGNPSDGRIVARIDNQWGAIDLRGREVVPFQFDYLSDFFMGRAAAYRGGKCGIIDTLGREILPIRYDNTTRHGDKYVYCDSLALVQDGDQYLFVNLEGRILPTPLLSDAYNFNEGLAAVQHDGLWGYINTRGEVVIPFRYDMASPFEWGRAEVYKGDQMNVIDKQGNIIKRGSTNSHL